MRSSLRQWLSVSLLLFCARAACPAVPGININWDGAASRRGEPGLQDFIPGLGEHKTRPVARPFSSNAPKNPISPQQRPYFDLMQVQQAWDLVGRLPRISIGVIDTGFDFEHPVLAGQAEAAFSYSGPGVIHAPYYEDVAHGTLVASIIGAHGGGMAGLCPNCDIFAAQQGTIEHVWLKSLRQYIREHPGTPMNKAAEEVMRQHGQEIQMFSQAWGKFIQDSVSESIRQLTDKGVKVINVSIFLSGIDINDAMAYAVAKDVVVVLGAGNSATRVDDYPGDSETVLVAGASMLADTRWEQTFDSAGTPVKQGSCYGPRLSVMAPVQDIVVAAPHDEKAYQSPPDGPMGEYHVDFGGPITRLPVGATSSAAPMVTALAGMVRSLRPDLSVRDVVRVVKAGTDRINEGNGFDIYTGHGRINFLKTLQLAQSWKKSG